MADREQIPMFPLAILPLPGELVPLHIFEPRYRQLIQEAEDHDINFGIYFTSDLNAQQIGSLMSLESIIKKYPGGESDVVVKCADIFTMDHLYRTYKNKMYPGGDVRLWGIQTMHLPGEEMNELFAQYLNLRNISHHIPVHNIYQIANELNLDASDRYRFLTSTPDKRESILLRRLKFLSHILLQEKKSKDVFHLN